MFSPEALAGYVGTAIFTLINLFVIYLILKRFLFRPFEELIDKRQALIESQLDEAKQEVDKAKQNEQESEQELKQALRKASDILNEARQKALSQEALILKEASEEAQKIQEQAREESKRIRTSLYSDMRDEIADLAVSISSKVISTAMSQNEQKQLVNRLLDEEIHNKQTTEVES